MTAREELAAVLAGQTVRVQVVNVGMVAGFLRAESALHLTDALLASPALARVIREAKAEAWDEGRRAERRGWFTFDLSTPDEERQPWPNPYRDPEEHGDEHL